MTLFCLCGEVKFLHYFMNIYSLFFYNQNLLQLKAPKFSGLLLFLLSPLNINSQFIKDCQNLN